MAYPPYRLERRPSSSSYFLNHQNYGQYHASHMDEFAGLDGHPPIDPNLEHCQPSTLGHLAWPPVAHPHQLQQFVDGPSTTLFTISQFQPSYMYHPYELNPLPSLSQGRHGSPFSQHHSSSSSDSFSPPTESDVLPATPPDTSAMSPFLRSSKLLQNCNAQSQGYFLAGIARPYVKLLDINPSQDYIEDEKPTGFDGSMAYSFSSAESLSDAEPQIKDEICVAESLPQTAYPDPDSEDRGQSDPDIDVVVTKYEEEDEDWTPKTARKRARSDASKSQDPTTRPVRKRARVSDSIKAIPLKSSYDASSPLKRRVSCTECSMTAFRDEAALEKHMKAKHVRPFVCVFNFAGCGSSFPSKNEWKRHVVTQHLALNYWLCTQGNCERCTHPPPASRQPSSDSSSTTSTSSMLPRGAIFNRKDLYTQHVRRMHVPPPAVKAVRQKKPSPEWEQRLHQMQSQAERKRCNLPSNMKCPAAGCKVAFEASNAWDQYMEHVAKHLEAATEGREQMPQFGGDEDSTLITWAASPEVGVVQKTTAGGWELMNPLRQKVLSMGGIGNMSGRAHLPYWKEVLDRKQVVGGFDADGEIN